MVHRPSIQVYQTSPVRTPAGRGLAIRVTSPGDWGKPHPRWPRIAPARIGGAVTLPTARQVLAPRSAHEYRADRAFVVSDANSLLEHEQAARPCHTLCHTQGRRFADEMPIRSPPSSNRLFKHLPGFGRTSRASCAIPLRAHREWLPHRAQATLGQTKSPAEAGPSGLVHERIRRQPEPSRSLS